MVQHENLRVSGDRLEKCRKAGLTMYDRDKQYSREASASKHGRVGEAERRNADRHTVTVSAEVTELSSGAKFSTRTTDLGPGGCFVDTLCPFAVGAGVNVRVRKGQSDFTTQGVVVYSQTGIGMGIAFGNMEPHQRAALDTWLSELTGSRQTAPLESRSKSTAPAAGPLRRASDRADNSTTVVRLIQLMITKGILTEAEGASVLNDRFFGS
jgi:hypothetical protein